MALDPFEESPDPAAVFAAEGARLRANAAFAKAFPHAISGARPPWGRVQPPRFTNGERIFTAAAPDGKRYEWRERQMPDGTQIAVARDISAHVDAADHSARAKTTLFATLTHELRTPLNGVLGMAEILGQTLRTPAEREYLAAIRKSGEHLLTLITEILDYARLDSEADQTRETAFDPEDMVQSIAELLSPRAQAKGVEICVRLAREAPLKVLADEQRLRQILFNLVGNAVKFTDQGAVAIDLSAPSPNRLRFSVRDTGPGVPKEMQARIFEEFVQADSAAVRRAGAGLGLAIVQKLVTKLGGELGIESKPGEGAMFWVELPVRALARVRDALTQLAGLRVRIAAKNDVLASTLADMVAGAGGVAVRCRSGNSTRADVILLDHALAGGDVSGFSGAPVIVLIPQEDRAAIPGYQRAGVRHYLIKPVRRSSLIERIQVATGRAKDAPPVQTAAHGANSAPARVLLAEDNPINALIARTLLERAGCAVTVVENGAAAVQALQGARFDLAFLDLRMPVLDGISTARQVRAMALPAGATPLIALTADAGEGDRAEALAAGMNDFVTKPIEAARLADVLARFTEAPNEAKLAAS